MQQPTPMLTFFFNHYLVRLGFAFMGPRTVSLLEVLHGGGAPPAQPRRLGRREEELPHVPEGVAQAEGGNGGDQNGQLVLREDGAKGDAGCEGGVGQRRKRAPQQ